MEKIEEVKKELEKMQEWKALEEMGIDPIGILNERIKGIERYSIPIGIKIAKNALLKKYKNLKDSEEFEGIILSNAGVDRFGSKAPLTWPLLTADGKILSISSWDDIGKMGKFKVLGTYDNVYQNILINQITEEEFDTTKIPSLISKIAKGVDDDYSLYQKYQTVAITGIINWINPLPIWENGEKVGLEFPFDPILRPIFNIVLESGVSEEGVTNHITVSLQKCKKGHIEIDSSEITEILNEVSALTSGKDVNDFTEDDLQMYIDDLSALLKGIQITAIGELVSLKDAETHDGDQICYITMRALKIFGDLNLKPEPTETISTEEKIVPRGVDVDKENDKTEEKPKPSMEQKLDEIKRIARDIEKLNGRLPTVEELKSQLKPDQAIFAESVLKSLNKEEN